MKRLLMLAALLGWGGMALAVGRADEIVAKLAAGFRAMKGYEVTYTITAGMSTTPDINGVSTAPDEPLLSGGYSVEGERYYLALGDAEVFCDGKTRYEVDNRRREVMITSVNSTSRDILNNPVRAFDFLASDYTAALAWEQGGKAAVTLTPVSKAAAVSGVATVTVDTASMRPVSLVYDYEGERVTITIGTVALLKTPLKRFDKARYAGYEFIDFR